MHYSMLLIKDQQGDKATWLILGTDPGRAVVLFEDTEKMMAFARAVSAKMLEPGQEIIRIQMEFSSIEEAARDMAGEFDDDVVFLADSDPIVAEAVASFLRRP